MGTSDAAVTPATNGTTINLPAGVKVAPGRQTSQTSSQGQVVQGTLYPITLPNNTTSSVFVPDSLLGQLDQVEALFTNKINSLSAIPVG